MKTDLNIHRKVDLEMVPDKLVLEQLVTAEPGEWTHELGISA